MIHWRGPPPYLFVPLPGGEIAAVREASRRASYGWGCIPVEATIAGADFTTALFPRDGGYLLPVKAAVRKRTAVSLDDVVAATVTIRAR